MKIKLLSLSFLLIAGISMNAANNIWKISNKNSVAEKIQNIEVPQQSTIYKLDLNALSSSVVNAPLRGTTTSKSNVLVSFPNLKGELEQYRVEEAPVMHPDLAAKYPQIKSYVGYGINHPKKIRFSVSPQKGLSAMIMGGKGTIFIEPYSSDLNYYAVFNRSNDETRQKTFNCLTDDIPFHPIKGTPSNKDADDQTLRTFDLAMSATGEYTAYHGGTKPGALAAECYNDKSKWSI